MADFYTAKQLADIMESHKRSLDAMQGAVQQLGDAGERGVLLWAQAEALVDSGEADTARTKKQTDVQGRWGAAMPHLVKAIDALAQGAGVTRKVILDQLATQPATNFGV